HRVAGHHPAGGTQIDQLAGRHQIALATLQCADQLVLGLGDDLQADLLTVTGTPVEVVLEGDQPMVFDAHWLALDLAGAVAALVDQHAQHPAFTDLRQVAHLG
uniref:LysR family transcriptional regulator n=1 Tax=Steinernema glaseri TaxID=37863 RepID=A0A1I7XWH4_9BILA